MHATAFHLRCLPNFPAHAFLPIAIVAARVQLHACRSGVGGSSADYETIASADIPLACLVSGGLGLHMLRMGVLSERALETSASAG